MTLQQIIQKMREQGYTSIHGQALVMSNEFHALEVLAQQETAGEKQCCELAVN